MRLSTVNTTFPRSSELYAVYSSIGASKPLRRYASAWLFIAPRRVGTSRRRHPKVERRSRDSERPRSLHGYCFIVCGEPAKARAVIRTLMGSKPGRDAMSAIGRYCCKSLKMPRDYLPAIKRNKRTSPVDVTSSPSPKPLCVHHRMK